MTQTRAKDPTAETTPTESPKKARKGVAVPYYVACFINMVRGLISYGTYLDTHMPRLVRHPRYPTLAAGWGTHDPSHILRHIERGLMRAQVLLRYLQAMAKAGQEIEPNPPETPATAAEIAALATALPAEPPATQRQERPPPVRAMPGLLPRRTPPGNPDHPLHFTRPSTQQLWADMRRLGPVANLTLVVLDLGGHFGLFGQKFHHNMIAALTQFPGGDIAKFNETHARRRKSFQEERERRPDTWTHHLWDRTKDALRDMLGFLLGEDPPEEFATASSTN